jgi:hypothetical protein
MVNYNNAVIYKICCNDVSITDCYVGSTCNFTRRKCAHKCGCNSITNKSYNLNVYTFIRANGGWENWNMVQVEAYEAKDKRDLETRERFHMEQLNSSLNKRVPTRTEKEYYEDNKEQIKKYKKKYDADHKEEIIIKNKEYNDTHKDEMKEYYKNNKTEIGIKKKKYYDDHKEELIINQKKYYDDHKEEINIKKNLRYQNNKLRNFILL